MMVPRIIPAVQPDFPNIVAVWEASVRATHHFLTEDHIQYFKPLILNEYLHAVQLYCVKDMEEAVVGFLGVADEKVEMLFVHPHSFKLGIGKALMQYAIQNLNVCKVDVNEQNPAALEFYKKMGFVVTARSPLDGMGKPFPILHMSLRS
ncbi:putative acetyltransferase [Chitinophaga skermanii]|uniref:Putative acetyltransferase n=1 Tax=Chitinophaga skermanii TaxID=331697 RepID=A0A327QD57_9BACT|nr:GNAT family N-acetyltransferase [Chitinophaga skermanii]RAJ02410.1 putative acetyltransferase [Chitinophaga skermanii]